MSEEVIKYEVDEASEEPKQKKKNEPKVVVTWTEAETPDSELERLGLKNDENV